MEKTARSLTANSKLSSRAEFILRVYLLVAASLAALVGFEIYLFQSGLADVVRKWMSDYPWILILGAFMLIGWMARRVAYRIESRGAQYAALAAYIVAKGIIVLPLLGRAERMAPGLISSAAQITLMAAVGLVAVVWWTKEDFSFLRGVLRWGGIMSLITIVGALLFGWHLGTWFNLAMVALAGCSILYDTSKVMRHHRTNRYVAEALSLFASIAMMFFYVLRQLTRLQRSTRV